MYVLDMLWRGKLSPNEQCVKSDSEYSRIRGRCLRISRLISAELSEDGKQLFQEYEELREQMCAISEEDVFTNGFRIGVGLILDGIGTHESQFVRYHED